MYPHSWSADHERGSCTQGSLRLVAASASTEGFSPLRSFPPSGLPQDDLAALGSIVRSSLRLFKLAADTTRPPTVTNMHARCSRASRLGCSQWLVLPM